MADDKVDNIPTLDSIVELGKSDDDADNIHIVADSQAMDDAYDDEFNKLFEPATATANGEHHEAIDSDLDDNLIDRLWDDDNSGDTVTDTQADANETIAPLRSDASADDLADIHLTASNESPDAGGDDAESDDNMWIQDWQEESREDSMMHAEATDDALQAADLDMATDDPAPATVVQAVATEDDTPTQDVAATPTSEAELTERLAQIDAIPELANEIVRQIMPEIEWKLRTRIREILEQRLTDSD